MNCDVRLVATALVVAVCALISTAAATAIRIGRAYTDMDRVQARLDAATRAAIGGISPGERRPGVVIYIGESTGREAGSAFSAALVNEAFKANVVQFADVVSPHSHTSLSLLRALTISADPMYDQLLPDRDLYRANLISVLGKMGIETEWYSNQYRTEWPARLFAVKAKHAQFQDDHSRPAMLEHHGLDSDLLPAITTRVRRMDRSVLMIHSYAGHGPYCDNIPSAYLSSVDDVRTRLPFQASFGDIHVFGREMYLREIECYDAAMSYVADNLRRVMRAVWENGKPVVLIYFSDHGEDVLEGTGHDSGSPSFRKVEVPMFVFFNDAAKQQFATAFQAAQSNRDRPYSLAWISDSIMDIAGLQMKRPLLSIFRPLGYVPDRFSSLRELGGRRTIVAVDNDEAARGRAAIADIDLYEKRRIINTVPLPDREKLCAHRADSLVKFTDAVKAFSCLEVDVVVDPQAGEAYVYHPPKQNNHLTLRALIENAPKGWSKLWLDTKNLTEDNAQFYLGYLNSVFPPEQRHKVLVETTIENVDDRTAAALTSFRKSDYMLSYYLPTDAAIRCSRLAIDVGCGAFAMHVQKVISTLPYNSLSFDVHAKGFAEHLKTKQNIDLNTWDETLTSKADLDLALLRVVGMYVIPYRSKFDY